MSGKEFIRLMLEVNKHTDGFVDAYYGPEDIGESVKSGALIPRPELKAQLKDFEANFNDPDQQRQAYVLAMIRAAKTALVLDTDENPPYEDEVRLLFDVGPELIDTYVFDEANEQLSDLLPGTGTIAERTKAYFDHYILDSDKIDTAIQICLAETRKRTAQLVDLVEGEGFSYAVVNDKPWAAYNWYQGNMQSLIEFNSDIPMNSLHLLDTCAHEGYPGHHTENMLKERLLYQEKGHSETSVVLLLSPAAVIAEGIATTALEIIFPNDTANEWMDNELFPVIGIEPHLADVRQAISKARKDLAYLCVSQCRNITSYRANQC